MSKVKSFSIKYFLTKIKQYQNLKCKNQNQTFNQNIEHQISFHFLNSIKYLITFNMHEDFLNILLVQLDLNQEDIKLNLHISFLKPFEDLIKLNLMIK